MDYLKEFADQKIEEAVKAAFTDGGKILETKEIKKFLKNFLKSKCFTYIENNYPLIPVNIKDVQTAVDKFEELKTAFDKIKKFDLKGTEPFKNANFVVFLCISYIDL